MIKDQEGEVSLRELLSRLPGEFRKLMRTDFALMRAEVRERLSWLKLDMILLAAGVVFAAVGGLCLVAALIAAIAYALPTWLSCLIVGLFLSIGGASAALAGLRRLKETDWTPRQTAEMLKEEGTWLKERLAQG